MRLLERVGTTVTIGIVMVFAMILLWMYTHDDAMKLTENQVSIAVLQTENEKLELQNKEWRGSVVELEGSLIALRSTLRFSQEVQESQKAALKKATSTQYKLETDLHETERKSTDAAQLLDKKSEEAQLATSRLAETRTNLHQALEDLMETRKELKLVRKNRDELASSLDASRQKSALDKDTKSATELASALDEALNEMETLVQQLEQCHSPKPANQLEVKLPLNKLNAAEKPKLEKLASESDSSLDEKNRRLLAQAGDRSGKVSNEKSMDQPHNQSADHHAAIDTNQLDKTSDSKR